MPKSLKLVASPFVHFHVSFSVSRSLTPILMMLRRADRQDRMSAVCTQPDAWSHESTVQGLPSSQSAGPVTAHVPLPSQALAVQASPSSQALPIGAGIHIEGAPEQT